MYCNQCGQEIKDSANFCKKCGAPIDDTESDISEEKRSFVKYVYTNRKRIFLCLIGALFVCALVIGAMIVVPGMLPQQEKQAVIPAKAAADIDLKDAYEIEDDRLMLDPLSAAYEDGTVQELKKYDVYIDSVQCRIEENAIDASALYDGKHLVRIEWKRGEKTYQFEKTVSFEHKKDTWGKYVDLVGKTGKEIAASYSPLGAPEYGSFSDGDWGYAYVYIDSLSLQVCFPAGVFNKPDDYSDSDVKCVEMSGALNTLFYNMESEMSMEELAQILGVTLTAGEEGGCSGTLSDGKLIYIDAGQAPNGVYTPDTTARITVSDEQRSDLLKRLF